MGMAAGDRSSDSSSSGEEDGDVDWKAAIDSVATTTFHNGFLPTRTNGSATQISISREDNLVVDDKKTQEIKRFQLKAQKLLDNILGKSIEIVSDPIHDSNNDSKTDEGGVRLFKDAPIGIVFDHVDELQGPRRRPRIVPAEELDEKSKKFKGQVKSVAVDGTDILAAAENSCRKRLAKMEARDAARKAAAKREEERVAQLKKIRGERWLPAIAICKQSLEGNRM